MPSEAEHSELIAVLNSAKANGDPNKYAAFLSVKQAHDAAQAITTLTQQLAEAREALQSIAEYWNRDRNDEAMHNACWHSIETAQAALEPKP